MKVYPQPASHELMIESNYVWESGTLLSIDGKLIHSFSQGELEQNRLSVSTIETGMYLLQLKTKGEELVVKKIIIGQ